MVNSLGDMNARMQQWMNEKPSFDNGNELRLKQGDVTIFQFLASGQDGDRFIKIYRAHVIEQVGKNGRRFNNHRYCPIQSADETIRECALCAQGHANIKERMSIWMFIHSILHTQVDPQKPFPQQAYNGGVYFVEQVNGFKVWHTSAWRESPWNDIVRLEQMYKGLHNFTAQMDAIGADLQRRYKLYPLPNSAVLSQEAYASAQSLEPIPNMLRAELNTPITINPQTTPVQQVQQPQAASVVTAFSLPGASSTVPVFTPGAAPILAPIPEVPPSMPVVEAPVPVDVSSPPPPPHTTPVPEQVQAEEDNRRPLKSMF